MPIPHLIAAFLILILASLVAPSLARLSRVSTALILVLLGFGLSELVVALGGDTGVRASSFQPLIFNLFLPLLIFEAAYQLNGRQLLRSLPPILLLAILGLGLATLITAIGVYWGINHPGGFPFTTALVCGALLAATDPVAVVDQLKAANAPKQLSLLLEGESLFNDATAVVLFSLFLMLALGSNEISAGGGALLFGQLFFGGLLWGALWGFALGLVSKWLTGYVDRGLLTLLAAYGSFWLAEHWLHLSGIMAALSAGISLAYCHRRWPGDPLHQLWQLLGSMGNSFVFLLMGVTITLNMFTERWLAILIAIGAVLLARWVSCYGSLFASRLIPIGDRVPKSFYPVITWGGLRGVIAIALALSLPTELEGWWTVQSIAFGVVMFSLVVQAPISNRLLRRLD